MDLLYGDAVMKSAGEITTTIPLNQGGTNHAENPLETNPTLLYGILIGVLVVLIGIMAFRKVKKKNKQK